VSDTASLSLHDALPISLDEEGLTGFSLSFWYGLAGPAGLPDDVVRKLFDASTQALADPAVRQRLATLGYEPAPSASPEEFRSTRSEEHTSELQSRSDLV